MLRKVLFLAVFVANLSANAPYTMYAQEVISQGRYVYANGRVMIYHQSSVYKADKAVYDREKKLLKLLGEVTAINGKSISKSRDLELRIDSKKTKSKRFFIFDANEGLWLRGSQYKRNSDIYEVKNSEVSSCDVKNPDWKILFNRAKYNKKREFLTLYQPTFYFKNAPVFGLPWFAFPTIKDRTTGLLRPTFGVQVDSGFVYMQPYFYAPYKNWDITLTPQVRTKRGWGVYSELNFVDTPYSKGKMVFGSFYDKDSYVKDKNLKNSSHYGVDFRYQSDRVYESFLDKKESQDGMWLDIHYLNDVDYENLKELNIRSVNKLVTSRFNYFLKRDRDFFGIYAKYFIDTDKKSNSDTMQELPTLEYHRFVSKLPIKHMTYSIDYKAKRQYRRKGLNAIWYETNLPIKFSIPLANEYLNLSISENLYYNSIKYSNKTGSVMEDARYFSNYHKFVLSSDLTKSYDDVIHNLQLEASLQIPSFEDKDGDFADFIKINKEEKNLKLSANQYFYDFSGYNFLSLRTSQIVYLKEKKHKYGDIYNEIKYNYSNNLSFTENIDFSTKYKKVKKIQSVINYHDQRHKIFLSHTYQKLKGLDRIDYLTTSFESKLDGGFVVDGRLDYDRLKKLKKSWSFGVSRYKKCWNYSVRYKESITPIFTSSGAKSYKNRGLYFLVNFANIGGIAYEYSKEDITEDLVLEKSDG